MRMATRARLLSRASGWAMLLIAGGALMPGAGSARERSEQPVVNRATRDFDAELLAAQDAVRLAQEKVRFKQRAGGRELRDAQEELVQARERLRALSAEASIQRSDNERQQWIERLRREKESADAQDAEQARQRQEEARRLAEEKQLKKERDDAERQRQADYWNERMQKLEERNQRQAAGAAAEQQRQRQEIQREQAKPQNVLKRVYASYIQVKRCHASLSGKTFVYVDDRDLATAREQTKFIEGKLLSSDPSVDRDSAWRAANERDPAQLLFADGGEEDVEAGMLSQRGQEFCRGAVAAVKEQYLAYNPDAAIVRKDF